MIFVVWNDSYSVKVSEIDRQHQRLFAIMNELYDAMRSNTERSHLAVTLNELVAYADTHFKTEEKYFDLFDYPEKNEQKERHAYFIGKISGFQNKFARGKVDLSLEVMTFLKEWLLDHIKVLDKKYADFFNENGLQ